MCFPHRFPLLDRGWVLAVAHIRGGGHLGPLWHEAGKGGLDKPRGTSDLVACSKRLIEAGFAQPGGIVIETTSAGGGYELDRGGGEYRVIRRGCMGKLGTGIYIPPDSHSIRKIAQ